MSTPSESQGSCRSDVIEMLLHLIITFPFSTESIIPGEPIKPAAQHTTTTTTTTYACKSGLPARSRHHNGAEVDGSSEDEHEKEQPELPAVDLFLNPDRAEELKAYLGN